MKIVVSLKVEDYVYAFYDTGAKVLGRSTLELMEQALIMYAGIVAEDLSKEIPPSVPNQTGQL